MHFQNTTTTHTIIDRYNISYAAKHLRMCCIEQLLCLPSPIAGMRRLELLPLNACFTNQQPRLGPGNFTNNHVARHALKYINASPKGSFKSYNLSWFTLWPTSIQISNSIICISGPKSTLELESTLHKQIRIHKDVWRMLEVRWSPPPLALPIISFSLLGLYDEYGISQLPLLTNHVGLIKPYSLLNL